MGCRPSTVRVVNSGSHPTDQDRRDAIGLALSGLASGEDPFELVDALEPLHRDSSTFPADVLLELAAEALELGGVSREAPIEYEGLRERFLPEWEVRGKLAHHRSHYALRAVPMIAAGVAPDLIEEMGWQQVPGWWIWSVYGLVVYTRAAADHSDQPVADLIGQLAQRHGVQLGESL